MRPPRWWEKPLPLLLALGVLAVSAVALYGYLRSTHRPAGDDAAAKEGERLCRQFMEWKNNGDPRANELLGPVPEAPTEAVGPEEADHLDAEFLLRCPFQVKEVRPVPGSQPPQFRLVTATARSILSEYFPRRTPQGVERIRPALFNPDIIVEVRDGKLHGVRAQSNKD